MLAALTTPRGAIAIHCAIAISPAERERGFLVYAAIAEQLRFRNGWRVDIVDAKAVPRHSALVLAESLVRDEIDTSRPCFLLRAADDRDLLATATKHHLLGGCTVDQWDQWYEFGPRSGMLARRGPTTGLELQGLVRREVDSLGYIALECDGPDFTALLARYLAAAIATLPC